MIDCFTDNIATIIVVAVIGMLALAALRKIRKDIKAGIHSCGGNCRGCSMGGMCSRESIYEEENNYGKY